MRVPRALARLAGALCVAIIAAPLPVAAQQTVALLPDLPGDPLDADGVMPPLRSAPLSPEMRLREAVAALQRGEWRRALKRTDALIAARPDFRAAHFLRGEILAGRSGVRPEILLAGHGDALGALAEETRLRIAPLPTDADAGLRPAPLLRLPASVEHALLVDLSAARLFVVSRDGSGLRVTRDLYAAMGSAGFGKQVEGDNRTPIGVYRIESWIDGGELPDLYGSGAYPVDYPNDWDRHRDRTGHGIWLHGVPGDTYARLPRSSEGCVTMANDDLEGLDPMVTTGNTPVILAERIEWLPPATIEARTARFEQRVEDWRRAWMSGDTDALMAFYAPDFNDGTRDREAFEAHKRAVSRDKEWIDIAVSDLAIYEYPGEENLRLVSFHQRYSSDTYASHSVKRQYWRLQPDGHWRIERSFERDERPITASAGAGGE